MKKILFIIFFVCSVMSALAQKDVTKFLGIPIDGYKPAMQQKLIDKGFTYDKTQDCFTGEFNGHDVRLYIVTNNNKVYRIMVEDANPSDETDIKIRFNKLCKQFEKNKKYTPTNWGTSAYTIAEETDISYEMSVHNKRFEATYFQNPEDTVWTQQIQTSLLEKYSQEQIANPSEELATEIRDYTLGLYVEILSKKSVWFMISEKYGNYRINLYYDNEYNHSDGEDL